MRITIVLDDKLAKQLRVVQSDSQKVSTKNISFSTVINQILKKGLKNPK